MKKICFMVVMLLSASVGAEENCHLLAFEGDVVIRKPFVNQFEAPAQGMALEDKMVLNASSRSEASIRTYDGSVFVLRGNAQIEVDELRKRDRNDLLMQLTGLEIQQLPDKNANTTYQTAFVLHGEASEEPVVRSDEKITRYIEQETNGARTLYEQGYVSGFIIKWTRLLMVFPDLSNPEMDDLILKAYDQMNMPFRKQKYLERLKNQ